MRGSTPRSSQGFEALKKEKDIEMLNKKELQKQIKELKQMSNESVLEVYGAAMSQGYVLRKEMRKNWQTEYQIAELAAKELLSRLNYRTSRIGYMGEGAGELSSHDY